MFISLYLERNFKEAKRLKEERETLTLEGVESQGKLESLLHEIAGDKKLLEKAERESNDLDSEICEQDRAAGKDFNFVFLFDRCFGFALIQTNASAWKIQGARDTRASERHVCLPPSRSSLFFRDI